MENVLYTSAEKISLIEANSYAVRVSKDSVRAGRAVSTTKTSYAYQAGVKSSVDTAFSAVVKDLLLTANPAGSGGGAYSEGDGIDITGAVISADFLGSGAAVTVSRSDHDHAGTYDLYSSWTVADDHAHSDTVSTGETVTFADGAGVSVIESAGRVITVTNTDPGSTALASMHWDFVANNAPVLPADIAGADVYEPVNTGNFIALIEGTNVTFEWEPAGGYYKNLVINTTGGGISIGTNPANNRLCTWSDATTIQGEPNLTFDGSELSMLNMGLDKRLYLKSGTGTNNVEHTGIRFITDVDGRYAEIVNKRMGSSNAMALLFRTWNTGAVDAMFIDADGKVGFNDTSPSYQLDVNGTGRFTGAVTFNSHAYFGTNDVLMFGASNEGRIWHDATDFYIKSLKHGGRIIMQGENLATGANKDLIIADPDGAVELYHAGIKKAETSADGVDIVAKIGTDNWVSETTGWKGDYAGEFDFRRIFTNELVAQTFIADIDLALLSGHIVTKSVTQVSRDFTVPATTATGTLYCECLPGHPAGWCFAVGDWIRLQIIDRSGGGLVWVQVWATVTAQLNINGAGDTNTGEQSYTITIQDDGGSPGSIVHGGAAAQDFGVSGDGFIQQEAGAAAGSDRPWLQVATWETDPSVGANITVRSRLGNLDGITGQSGFGLVTRKDNNNYVSQWWNTDADWGIRGYVAGDQVFTLGDENVIAGWTITNAALTGGAAATTIALTPATGIHMGAAAFADAPFSVTNVGALKAEIGLIGGWNLATDAFYTGTKHVANGFSTTGITLASGGAIHAPNFYVDAADEIGFRAEKLIKAYKGVSDTIILSHDAVVNTIDTAWVLKKTITLGADLKSGTTLRIKFGLYISDGAYIAYGGIWKNGGSVGAEQSTSSTISVPKSQDIADWDAGDTIELKIRTSNASGQASAENFRVCGIIAEIVDEVTGTNS